MKLTMRRIQLAFASCPFLSVFFCLYFVRSFIRFKSGSHSGIRVTLIISITVEVLREQYYG